jgi:ubiquitin-conjugating enzyme E2 G1
MARSQPCRYALVCIHSPSGFRMLILIASEGGFFKARLTFPPEFPDLPPKMRFITPMWHPNSAPPYYSVIFIFLSHTSHSLFQWRCMYLDPCKCPHPNHFPIAARLNSPCHSSKHAPGNDQYGYEDAGERWMPVHSVESIVSCMTDG